MNGTDLTPSARELISGGHPTRAIELIREGLKRHPEDLHLKYLMALAFSRGGNIAQAERYTNELLAVPAMSPELWVETLSLKGSYFKNLYRLTANAGKRKKFAKESARWYQRAYETSSKLFPLINYATMSLLSDHPDKAQKLAREVLDRAKAQGGDREDEAPYWLPATLAEAHFLLEDFKGGFTHLREAIRLAGDNTGDVNTIRKNLLLLKEWCGPECPWDEVDEICDLGSVMVCAGHMIDPPLSYRGRFPPHPPLVHRVQEGIRKVLKDRNVTVAYCSASCGTDLLFAREALNRGAELHVVLPFRLDDFFETSVDFGLPAMAWWRTECQSVVSSAKHVHYATAEPYLRDDVLFDFLNTFLHGLALTRAGERGVEAEALVVYDPTLPGEAHGTTDFLKKWGPRRREPEVIDLSRLREEAGVAGRPKRVNKSKPRGTGERELKVMLFADVKGFSKLSDEDLSPFFAAFLDRVSKALQRSPVKPALCNTWGDGLFVVFEEDDLPEAAGFALDLIDQVRPEKWGLSRGAGARSELLALRIGLHTGPVFRYANPIRNGEDFFGSHVNRAARIEPVTTPGCVFVSEQFAAALAVRTDHNLVCEFVGIEDLAKGYDRCPLYRLIRR